MADRPGSLLADHRSFFCRFCVFDAQLGREGWKLENANGKLTISGGRPRGVLYGVYDFLEKYIGARFLSAEFEHIPAVETITLYKSDVTEIPEEVRSQLEIIYAEDISTVFEHALVQNKE